MMESINIVINDYSASKTVESKDNDVFEIRGFNENFVNDGELLFVFNPLATKDYKDEEIEYYLPNRLRVLIQLTTSLVALKEVLGLDAKFRRP